MKNKTCKRKPMSQSAYFFRAFNRAWKEALRKNQYNPNKHWFENVSEEETERLLHDLKRLWFGGMKHAYSEEV